MAHGHTVLAQGLKLSPRAPIEAWDKVHGTGRPRRGLSRGSPFGALVLAQLAGRHRLRDVVDALASQAHALAPLGLGPPQRSTLADANARRPMALSQALLATRDARWRAVAPRPRVRFPKPLLALDSPTNALGWSRCPWAIFRPTKGP